MSKNIELKHKNYDCVLSSHIFSRDSGIKVNLAIYKLYFKLWKKLILLYSKNLKGKWIKKESRFELENPVLLIDKKYLFSTVQFKYEIE